MTIFINQEWVHKPTGRVCKIIQIHRKDKLVLMQWLDDDLGPTSIDNEVGRGCGKEYKRFDLLRKYYWPKTVYVEKTHGN